MDGESLLWFLEDLAVNRPWSFGQLLQFYYGICLFLNFDPGFIPENLPEIFSRLTFKLILTVIEIFDTLKSIPYCPELCQTLDDLRLFWESLPFCLKVRIIDRYEKREKELTEKELDTLLSSQFDEPVLQYLNGDPGLIVIEEDPDAMRESAEMVAEYFNQVLDQIGGGDEENFPIVGEIELDDPHCEILAQTEKHYPIFNMTGIELEAKITDNVAEGLVTVSERVLRDVAPSDRVQIVIRSSAFGLQHPDIVVSFRRRDQIDLASLLDEICESIYSDEEDLFFNSPVSLIFSIVRLPQGGRGKRKGVETFAAFSKNRRSIIRIQNSDSICLPRALCVGIALCKYQNDPDNKRLKTDFETLSHSKPNNLSQRIAALELCAKAGVRANKDCATPEALRKFRTYLKDYDILVYQMQNSWPTLVLDSRVREGGDKPRVILLNEGSHFNVVKNLAPLFGKVKFCPNCLEGYRRDSTHRCSDFCFSCCRSIKCTGEIKKCNDCLRDFIGLDCFASHKAVVGGKLPLCQNLFQCKDCARLIDLDKRQGQPHFCDEEFCTVCQKFCQAGHLCYIQVIKDPPRPPPRFDSTGKPNQVWVFYDFETVQFKPHEEKKNCFIHQPILCVSETYCGACVNSPDLDCRFCGDRQRQFLGGDAHQQFFDYLRTLSSFKAVTVIAHNSSNYDMQLLLQVIMESPDSFKPETIINGTRILEIKLYNLQFLDSFCYVPIPLSKFAATFELGDNYSKNYFPHFVLNEVQHNFDVNNPERTNYVSQNSLPPKTAYGADRFTTKDREHFDKWYAEQIEAGAGFNYLETLKLYCSQDTHILAAGCIKFMQLFEQLCQVNPFKVGVTIASVCSHVLRKKFLKPDTIGIIPANLYRLSENQSRSALEWMHWESHVRNVPIASAMNGREPRAGKIKLDGLYGDKNALQFHGCWFHGCRTCFGDSVNRSQPMGGNASDTLHTRYTNTMKTTNKLKQLGYDVYEKWECDWNREKTQNPAIKEFLNNSNFIQNLNERLDPRASFYGGRVCALRTYCNVEGTNDKILYTDICSLYPYINKRGKVPIGHPRILLDNIPDVEFFDGLLFCEVLPPTNLFHPVLPTRSANKKLVFTLCRTCADLRFQGDCTHSDEERMLKGVWVTEELRWAVKRGYKIVKKIEAWSYKVTQYNPETGTGGVFREYVDTFLKTKVEASGWPAGCDTDDTKAEYLAAFERAEGIKLDPTKIVKNEGLRAISKLMLNSMWGKLGQRSLVTKTEIIKDPKVFFELLLNPEAEIKSVLTINDHALLVKWAPVKEAEIPLKHANTVIASWTTSQARLVLLKYLEEVGDNAIYFDTDSLCYLAKDGNPIIKTGNCLGEMVDELSGYGENSYICEAVFGGPKHYSYWVKNSNSDEKHNVTKVKGFRINVSNKNIINGDNLKGMIGASEGGKSSYIVPLPKQIRRLPDHTLVSVDLEKTYRPIIDKVRLLPDFTTLPYGYR